MTTSDLQRKVDFVRSLSDDVAEELYRKLRGELESDFGSDEERVQLKSLLAVKTGRLSSYIISAWNGRPGYKFTP